MNRFWMKIVSSFTLVIFAPSAALAQPGAAMLYPAGAVMLNGNSIPGATALFQGDVVSTTANSIASFTTQNSRISITAQTTVKLDDKALSLQQGVVTVDTKGGFATHASRFSVAPAEGNAKYRVLRKGDAILVSSLEGPVLIKWGTNSHMMTAGGSWASPTAEGSANPQQGPYPVPAGKMPRDRKGLSAGTLILIGGGMAGLATGLALSASNSNAVSPVRP